VTAPVHDALVIGGGPAGATAGLLLARAGWSVVLVERCVFPRQKVCGEYLSATNLPLLDRLGVGTVFRELAGPSVRKIALFAGKTIVEASIPRPSRSPHEWGRALSRERLDGLLLDEARRAGADIRQPWQARSILRERDCFLCETKCMASGATATLRARVIVAAHGSWDPGSLATAPPRRPPAPSDLLGFKAHFEKSTLESDLMPLLAFPGGYGGMVHCEGDRVSLSCCLRRDQLATSRHRWRGDAGDVVLAHIHEACLGARRVLAGARRLGSWLAVGPVRPGMRRATHGGIFLIGNAAGEAHPVIAEGISIALQSAWSLCRHLDAWKRGRGSARDLARVSNAYAEDWRRHFVPRLQLSRLIAQWAMRPAAVASARPLLRCFPSILTWFARLSGKVHGVILPGD
jgi:flavin-dependent dehydrogenase